MKKWWLTAKFWLFVAVAFGVSILVLAVRALFAQKNPDAKDGGFVLPPVPQQLQEAADAAHTAAVAAKAESKAKNEADKKEIERISAIEDQKKRRQAFADFSNSR